MIFNDLLNFNVFVTESKFRFQNNVNLFHVFPSTTRRGGTAILPEYITLLRILLSSNSAVLINIITGVSSPHFDFVVFYYDLCQC
jgi:hypothetical protein